MIQMTLLRPFVSAALLSLALFAPAAAMAAQRDIQVLQSYVGSWEGRGTFGSGDNAESIKCRLTVTSAKPETAQFNGVCAIAGKSMSIRGSLGYFADKNRYEATMTSNADFNGTAIGRRNGSSIDFTMLPADDEGGARYKISAGLSLRNESIVVKARITDTVENFSTSANVPMDRKS